MRGKRSHSGDAWNFGRPLSKKLDRKKALPEWSMMSRFRNFDWLAVIFYPLAVVLMESFWTYPWLVWLGGWPLFSEQRPALSLAAVVVGMVRVEHGAQEVALAILRLQGKGLGQIGLCQGEGRRSVHIYTCGRA